MRNSTVIIFFVSCFMMSSCTSTVTHDDSKRSPHALDKRDQSHQQLCVYRETKGIAELLNIENGRLFFKFYPGDETIAINAASIPDALHLKIGDEIKALKKFLVRGHEKDDCMPIELILKPSTLY